MNSIFTFVILIILIILVGFFTSSETAYLSLPKLKVRSMVEERKPYAKIVYKLKSKVIQINEIENESVGYNGTYKTDKKELIAVIPIGYADGFIRKHTNSYVYINNKKYQIVGNICMDMMFVKVDETVKVNDEVELIKDNNHIYEIVSHLDTISYELACTITRRVPRIYK